MTDLRNHLFETLEDLRDSDKPLDLERAKAVVSVAQIIVNSAKVEVDLINAIGGGEVRSTFFGSESEGKAISGPAKVRQIGNGR